MSHYFKKRWSLFSAGARKIVMGGQAFTWGADPAPSLPLPSLPLSFFPLPYPPLPHKSEFLGEEMAELCQIWVDHTLPELPWRRSTLFECCCWTMEYGNAVSMPPPVEMITSLVQRRQYLTLALWQRFILSATYLTVSLILTLTIPTLLTLLAINVVSK